MTEQDREEVKRAERRSFYCVIMCLLCCIITVVVAPAVIDTSNSVDEQARINDLQDQVNMAQTRADKLIQSSRREAVVISCRSQNNRHSKVIFTLNTLLQEAKDRYKDDSERLARIESSRKGTLLLLNALVPYQNCERRADRLVGPAQP